MTQILTHTPLWVFGLFFGLPGRCEHAARRLRGVREFDMTGDAVLP